MSTLSYPPTLTKINHWVCCNANSKVPLNPRTGQPASVSNPDSWTDYPVAATAVEKKYFDYLGFVFTEDIGLVGIDIDTGFNGLLPTDHAMDIIETCKSYTEISKSGRGFHILVKGTLPFKGKNNGGLEIYKTGRYFIMTGRQLLYNDIISNQSAINYVVSKYFPEQLKVSQNVNKATIYQFNYDKPGKLINITPQYTEIKSGMRNNSMASLAGQFKKLGYDKTATLQQLITANS